MRLAINGATTMPYTLEQDIRAAGAVGFDAIEIWRSKLLDYLQSRSIEELADSLRGAGIEVASLCPTFIKAFSDSSEVEQCLCELEQAAALAKALRCPTILACPDAPPPSMRLPEAISRFATVARQAADRAADAGVRIALEPLGAHPFLDGPAIALQIIEQADRENLGLMIDTFHYHKSAVPPDQIERIPVERLYIVHINDAPALPRDELQDKDRLYPTEGAIDAQQWLRPIVTRGYEGAFSVELFRREYWQAPIDRINRKAHETGNKLLAQLREPG